VYSGDDPMEIWGTGMLVVGLGQLIVMQVRSHSQTTNNFNFTIMAIIVETKTSNRRTLSTLHFHWLVCRQCHPVHGGQQRMSCCGKLLWVE